MIDSTLQAGISVLKTVLCEDTVTKNNLCAACDYNIVELGKGLPHAHQA